MGEPIRINLQNALRSGVECDLTGQTKDGESYFSFQAFIELRIFELMQYMMTISMSSGTERS